MASRDVQLVIRAKDEASRALNLVADLIGQLDVKQKGASASGRSFATSLIETVDQMAKMERATGLVTAATERAEAAISRQRASVAETGAQLAAVTKQLANAREVIDRAQAGVVATLYKGGDATDQIASLKAARAEVDNLEAQQSRLTTTLGKQQAVLNGQESGFRELAATANTAEAALSSFGTEAERASLKAKAAATEATQALLEQAAAARQAADQQRAQDNFSAFAGVTPDPRGKQAARSAEVFETASRDAEALQRLIDKADPLAAIERKLATDIEEVNAALRRGTVSKEAAAKAIAQLERESDSASSRIVADAEREAAAHEKAARAANERFSAFAGISQNPFGEQAAASASVFEADFARQEADLRRLMDRLDPLSVIERRLAKDIALVNRELRDQKGDAAGAEKAIAELTRQADLTKAHFARVGRGANSTTSPFGLKPYELTNLGYQVNDLVTQVASGTSVMQAFAQQGGQILQLMPNIGARITGALQNPAVLTAVASFAALALVIKTASDSADRLRNVEAILDSMGEDADISAEKLADVAHEIERVGFSAQESLDLVRSFLSQGLNVEYLSRFAEAAQDLSDVTGQDLAGSVKDLQNAFTKGYQGVAEFDNRIQFLTVSEREHIRTMMESGREAEARTAAFEAFERHVDDQANKMRGEWGNAVKSLDRAFSDLLDTLASSDAVQGFTDNLASIIDDLAYQITAAEDLTVDQIERRLERLREIQTIDPGFTPWGAYSIESEIEDLERRKEAIEANRRAEGELGDIRDEESAAAQKRESDQLRQIDIENRLGDARSAAARIALEGEQAYQKAIDEGHTKRVAQARQEQAIARARREEDRKSQQERERRNAEFAKNIAENGRSQLIGTAQQYVGRREDRRGDNAVLQDLFKSANVNIDPKMVAWCAAFVNAVLATNGLPTVDQVTGGSDLRARDFLAYGSEVTKPEPGDIVILKRGNNAAQGHVGFFQGFTDNGDVRVLGGNQSNGVNEQTFKSRDVLGFRRAPSIGDVAEQQAKDDLKRIEQQADLNREIDEENRKRIAAADGQRVQLGLSGEALLNARREQAVQEALAQAREKAAKNELTINDERLNAIRETVEAEFDLANARERASAALDDATALRDSLLGELAQAERIGDPADIARIEDAIGGVDNAMRQAIRSAIAFYRTLGSNPQIEATIRNLENQLRGLDLASRDREQRRVEEPVQNLQAIRNALMEQMQFAREMGQTAVSEQLEEQMRSVEDDLLRATDAAIAFWAAQSGPEAQAALLNLQNLRNQVLASQNEFIITAGQLQDVFAGSLSDAFETFAQRLVETRDPLEALFVAGIQFAADFTRKLAEMGLEMLAMQTAAKLGFGGAADGLNSALGLGTNAAAKAASETSAAAGAAALSGAGGAVAAGGAAVSTGAAALSAAAGTLGASGASIATGGGTVAAGAGALAGAAASLMAAAQMLLAANAAGGGGVLHGGGIAGFPNRSRSVHPAWFSAAVRYHSGGVAGLRPNEVPTILEKGEEVLTRADPRHRWNGGMSGEGGGGSQVSISQILAIGDDEIVAAHNGAAGDKLFLTKVRRHKESIRTMLNG